METIAMIPALMITGMFEDELTQTKTSKERTWKTFLDKGTNHTAKAHTLPAILRRCEREGVAYRLTAMPGYGYFIEPLKEENNGHTSPIPNPE